MSVVTLEDCDFPEPDVSHLITEDDQPVDNFFQDKQQDLLTEALRVSWDEGRPFLSAADVAIFYAVKEAVVPDVLLSIRVSAPPDFREKGRRSYFIWVFGKPPEVVIEIVSNDKGKEDTEKLRRYAEIKVPYYVIYDPEGWLSARPLRIYQLSGASYVEKVDRWFPEVGLGLAVWDGEYDGIEAQWLRWTDRSRTFLEVGSERSARESCRADAESRRADGESRRADGEARRADEEARRAEEATRGAEQERAARIALEERLRKLGFDPTTE